MNTRWQERPLLCDALERAAAWAQRPGTLLLHDPGGRSALLFAPRWQIRIEAGGQLRRIGPVPNQLPLSGRPPDWPARWLGALRRGRRRRPLFCGVAGSLAYELGTLPWRAAAERPPRVLAPQLWLGLYDRALLFDSSAPPRLLVASLAPLCEAPRSLPRLWAEAAEQLLAAPAPGPPRPARPPAPRVEALDPRWHRRSVARIHDYLRAGDVYQINLTGQILAHADVDPFALFLSECQANPVSHAAFAQLGDIQIASHSPERLLRLGGSHALSSPIKGTARSRDARELALSAKDRAEHVMIVDLVRNDLGRSARFGSVEVSSLLHGMPLRGLHHLVSDVEATLRRGGRERVLGDLFPGGSITGAPKRRAVEIIAELETHRRGIYTGSIGYCDAGGHADWNIAIRTAVWQNGRVAFGCGGGIVLDSDPDREYEEAMLKAQSFLASLRELHAMQRAESACTSISTER